MPADLDASSALDLAAAIDERDPLLDAVIWLDEDDARARAATATERLAAEGPASLPPLRVAAQLEQLLPWADRRPAPRS